MIFVIANVFKVQKSSIYSVCLGLLDVIGISAKL